MTTAPRVYLRFNWSKGLFFVDWGAWAFMPDPNWITVAFPNATTLGFTSP